MYCYVVKLPVFSLQRGSAKSPIDHLILVLYGLLYEFSKHGQYSTKIIKEMTLINAFVIISKLSNFSLDMSVLNNISSKICRNCSETEQAPSVDSSTWSIRPLFTYLDTTGHLKTSIPSLLS